MHFKALRRDSSESSDMFVSGKVAVQERRLRMETIYSIFFLTLASAEVLNQLRESKQLVPTCIGYGAISQIARFPKSQMIAIAGRVFGESPVVAIPAEYVDDVRTAPIDDDGRALMVEIICAAAHEFIPLRFEICDRRRHVGMPGKPGLDGVFIGRHHIDEMFGHQRSHMGTYQVPRQGGP